MHSLLSLDLARVSGAAWRDSSGALRTRAFVLGKEGDLPAALASLERIVDGLLDESGAGSVTIEMDTGRGAGSITLRAYHAVAVMVAGRRGLKAIRKLNAASARKLAVGYGGADLDRVYALATGVLRLPPIAPTSTSKAVAALAIKSGRTSFSVVDHVTDDEADAAILLAGTERWLEAEAVHAKWRAAAKAQARRTKVAA